MLNIRSARGFTLVELMIATVVGLIVTGGAASLIVAIDQANSETIQATRLNQELRALASVIADELKRSRRLTDPVATILQGSGAVAGKFDAITTPSAGCVTYGYQGAVIQNASDYNDTSTSTTTSINYQYNFKAISRQTASSIGSVVLATSNDAANPPNCATAGTTLNSSLVDITSLTFTCVGGTGAGSCTHALEVDVTLSGRLQQKNRVGYFSRTNPITRTITQPVFIRSIAVL